MKIIKIYLKKVLTNNNLRVNIQSQTNKQTRTSNIRVLKRRLIPMQNEGIHLQYESGKA